MRSSPRPARSAARARPATTTSAPRSTAAAEVARAFLFGALLACGAAQALTIESCVSADALQVAAADAHAELDADDLAAAAQAIAERHPQLQRDGFAPAQLLLWDRPGIGWVYVALIENPERRGQRCFTATVSAGGIALTPQLLRKYFPQRTASAA